MPSGDVDFVSLGPLAAGNYSIIVTFEFTDGGDEVLSTVTLPPFPLAVGEGYFVPALDLAGLVGLVLGFALVGVVLLRR